MEKSPLLGRLDVGTVPASRLSRDSSFRGRGGRLRRREHQAPPRVTTSGALIADSRRASRRRVEKSVTAMGGQRTAGVGSCLTQRALCSHFALKTSRNMPKQGQEPSINRKR